MVSLGFQRQTPGVALKTAFTLYRAESRKYKRQSGEAASPQSLKAELSPALKSCRQPVKRRT